MAALKVRIEKEMGLKCFDPANGETITIRLEPKVPVRIASDFVDSLYENQVSFANQSGYDFNLEFSGCVVLDKVDKAKNRQSLAIVSNRTASERYGFSEEAILSQTKSKIKKSLGAESLYKLSLLEDWKPKIMEVAINTLEIAYPGEVMRSKKSDSFSVKKISVSLSDDGAFWIEWNESDYLDALDIMNLISQLNF